MSFELTERNSVFVHFDNTFLFATDCISYITLFNKITESEGIKPQGNKANIFKQLVSLVNNGIREVYIICGGDRVVVFTEDHKFIRSFSVLKPFLDIEDDDKIPLNDQEFKCIPEEYDAIAVNVNPENYALPEIFVGGFRSHVRVYDIYGRFLRKFKINDARGDGYVHNGCVHRLNILPHSEELSVSDCFNDEIRIYGFDGTFKRRIQCEKFTFVGDLVQAPNGNLLVTNMLSNNVLIFSHDGIFIRSFGDDFLKEPSAMAIHKTNIIIGCNDVIHILDSSYWEN
jgi:hypothetical protein